MVHSIQLMNQSGCTSTVLAADTVVAATGLSCLQARKQVADQQLEIAEVMGMCDTLLSEREKLKGGQ
jgi:hypothetical protein